MRLHKAELEPMPGAEDDEVDPLDAFMATEVSSRGQYKGVWKGRAIDLPFIAEQSKNTTPLKYLLPDYAGGQG